jgi:hypothetical protein
MVLGPDGVLLMAPNNPVFLATLSVADLELSWNQQYQCWWAPAFKYFELMAIVREFFTVSEDYPDDYVLEAIDPFRRYPALAGHLEALRAGKARLTKHAGDLHICFPELGEALHPLR